MQSYSSNSKVKMKSILKWALMSSLIFLLQSNRAQADDISLNGFGSAYYVQAMNPNLLPADIPSNHANFTNYSLLGLNVSANLTNNISFASQIVALGESVGSADSFSLIADWSYLIFKPANGTMIKIGRQLFPFTLSAEYSHVGYLLPYAEVPKALLHVGPFTRFDGVSASQEISSPIGLFTVGAFAGSPQLDANQVFLSSIGAEIDLQDLFGVVASLDGNGWRVKVQGSFNYTHYHFTVPNSGTPPISGDYSGHQHNLSAGGRYDKHNVVVWAEYAMTADPDGSVTNSGGRYIQYGEGYYGLIGYRIGKFMPRYTYAHGMNNFNIVGNGGVSQNGSLTTNTIGVNYEIAPQVVAKLDYEHMKIASPGSAGLFQITEASGSDTTQSDAFYLGVDFIF